MSKLQIAKYLIQQNPRGEAQMGRVKRQLARKFKIKTISNIDLLDSYRQAVKAGQIKVDKNLEKLLKTREVRTLSGVAPVAVLTKPYKCPGQCSFCPSEKAMPKSYLSNEPAVMRAIGTHFHPYKQVRARIEALEMTGHSTDKIELIIMGGTWSYLPKRYQNWYIKNCFDALNDKKVGAGLVPARRQASATKRAGTRPAPTATMQAVEMALKKNETAKYRCVGLTLETRPDYINLKEIKRMRELGCTKVELGIQAIDDDILKLNKRGNSVDQIINATILLKKAGFKICYHLMPNLPGSSATKDIEMYRELFTNPAFQPDMVKIYPCVVTKDSEIYKWWKKGKFTPYSNEELFKALLQMKINTPPYVRIIRLIRDIPAESIMAGSKVSNLRQDLQRELARLEKNCRCIRCREIKNLGFKNKDLKLKNINYPASGGTEYFLSMEDVKQDKLLAFLRLRLEDNQTDLQFKNFYKTFPELKNCAMIREIHTYGELAELGSIDKKVQHLGLGKKLIIEAEKIAKKSGYKKIAVISAVGTRGYYRKLGYKLKGDYLVKGL